MNEIKRPSKRIEYLHFISYYGKKYIREEVIIPECFSWESEPDKLIDLHTIKWRNYDEKIYQEFGNIEYYSNDMGWSKNGHLNKSNPIPKIEQKFKSTIGKNLIYF